GRSYRKQRSTGARLWQRFVPPRFLLLSTSASGLFWLRFEKFLNSTFSRDLRATRLVTPAWAENCRAASMHFYRRRPNVTSRRLHNQRCSALTFATQPTSLFA